MSFDYDYGYDARDDHDHGGHDADHDAGHDPAPAGGHDGGHGSGGGESGRHPQPADTDADYPGFGSDYALRDAGEPEQAETVELAADTGTNPVVVAISAAGGILASSFLQAIGSKLGEDSARAVTGAARRHRWWRPGDTTSNQRPDMDRQEAQASRELIRSIMEKRTGREVRVVHERAISVTFTPQLPLDAFIQYRQMDFTAEEIARGRIGWTTDPLLLQHLNRAHRLRRAATGAWRCVVTQGRNRGASYLWDPHTKSWEWAR